MTLLSTDEFRALRPTLLADEALETLLQAAEDEILDYAGPTGEVTEFHDGGATVLALDHRIDRSEPLTITETIWTTVVTLDPADYRIRDDNLSIERLDTGPNPSFRPGGYRLWYDPQSPATLEKLAFGKWAGTITVNYTTVDETAKRKRVQKALVELDINHNPGLINQRIGEWAESYDRRIDLEAARLDILSALRISGFGFA